MEIEINPQFQQALDAIDLGKKNLFVTGKAGTGKSTLLDYFCRNSTKKPIVLAPTGVAALNVKGQTIHSFFNFYVDVTPETIKSKKTRPKDPKLYKKLQSIIIDEVSMVRADLLDCVDVFLRIYGPDPTEPFGGIQMIFVGDLYQLPPVVTNLEKELFNGLYKTPYFFSARALENSELEVIELDKVYRQKDQEFVKLLNNIRNNSVEPQDIEHLNSRLSPQRYIPKNDFYISLTTTNKNADAINEERLGELDGKMHKSKAVISGDFGKEYFPTATMLEFKIGSQIMLLNNNAKRKWVNGSIGVIEDIKKDIDGNEYVNVRLHDSQKLVSVFAHVWEVFKFSFNGKEIISKAAGTFQQYPFRLAWAITIHKSQGKTFDKVVIDIGRGTFVTGQIYVALSRCTSFEGVILKNPIKKHHILTDTRIFKFLTNYQYKKAAKTLPIKDKFVILEKAICDKSKLKMTYLKANDTKTESVIIPLTAGTENYQGKLFPGMLALCVESQEKVMFHIGRILELKAL